MKHRTRQITGGPRTFQTDAAADIDLTARFADKATLPGYDRAVSLWLTNGRPKELRLHRDPWRNDKVIKKGIADVRGN